MSRDSDGVKGVLKATRWIAVLGLALALGTLLLAKALTSEETVDYLLVIALWGGLGLAVALLVVEVSAWLVLLAVDVRRAGLSTHWAYRARMLAEALLAPTVIWLMLLVTLWARRRV